MMTPVELKRFIRFGLGELRDENAHHAFEQIATAVARARIARNVIPATGPVGARGDQGRDAESIPRHDGEAEPEGLYGDVGAKTVVVTATLQQDRVPAKILSDVASIRSHTHLDADVVVAFCEANMSVGERNKVKADAADDHDDLTLHIIDGNGIAELLAAPDLNWVAHKYLDLPREAVPNARTDESDAWYLKQRMRWVDREPELTYGEFEEVRWPARHAYQHDFAADLEFWLELLAPFAGPEVTGDLRRYAVYEIALVNIRGKGTLASCRDSLEWYFSTIAEVLPSAALTDAQVLVTHCIPAAIDAEGGLDGTTVRAWYDAVVAHIDAQIDDTDNPARLFALLGSRGTLEVFRQGDRPKFAELEVWWGRALECAGEASLLPIDTISTPLTGVAILYSDDPAFTEFAARVDDIAAAQGGDSAAGELALERAASLFEDDQFTSALKEFHRCKDRFIAAHDTDRLLAVLPIVGGLYKELHLEFAAKQYFLAQAATALNSSDGDHRRHVALALFQASGCDYNTGGWLGFLDLATIATKAHHFLDQTPGDHGTHPILEPIFKDIGIVYGVACHHHPQFADEVLELARAHLPDELLTELHTAPFGVLAEVGRVAESLYAVPFDDANERRNLRWSAHGVSWALTTGPALEERRAAERLAASMQILAADLAGVDLVVFPQSFEVSVLLGPAEVAEVGPGRFAATVPAWKGGTDDLNSLASETLVCAIELLGRTSTISQSDFFREVTKRFELNLANKVTFFQIYDELASPWASTVRVVELNPRLEQPSPPPGHGQLGWLSGPGPGYSAEAAIEALENRYKNLMPMTAASVVALHKDPDFTEVVAELRSLGWRDWHLLGAVLSIAASYRMQRDFSAGRTLRPLGRQQLPLIEPVDDPVPVCEFTLDAMLRAHCKNDIVTFVKTWHRCVHLEVIPNEAVTTILAERYGHYADDVDHEDPFPSGPRQP